jgi:hypothetical protein
MAWDNDDSSGFKPGRLRRSASAHADASQCSIVMMTSQSRCPAREEWLHRVCLDRL